MKRPERAMLRIWQIRLLGILVIPYFLIGFFYHRTPELLWILVGIVTGIAGVLFFWILPMIFDRYAYELDGERIVAQSGFYYLKMKQMEKSHVQFCSIVASPLQRLHGLVTLRLFAAGGSVTIPGLKREEALAIQRLMTESEGMAE